MNTRLVDCTTCKHYGVDCNPEPKDFELPCNSYELDIADDLELERLGDPDEASEFDDYSRLSVS